MAINDKKRQQIHNNTARKEYLDLLLALAKAADGHLITIGGVLGIHPDSAGNRLQARGIRAQWIEWKKAQVVIRRRRHSRQFNWRLKLRNSGIDPTQLDPNDPVFDLCWQKPRGHLVADAAATLRATRPDLDLSSADGLRAVLALVDDARAARFALLRASSDDVDPVDDAPDDDGTQQNDPTDDPTDT